MTQQRRRRRGAALLAALGSGPTQAAPSVGELIEALALEAHVEGGYFRRTYAADGQPRVATPAGERYSLTSIFYLLTRESPVGHFHRNRSDIVHYFQLGDPITYYLLHRDGRLQTVVMGSDVGAGQRLQRTVPGGTWKASSLQAGGSHGYGLISEAVSPGFDYADMTLGDTATLVARFPDHAALIRRLSRPAESP